MRLAFSLLLLAAAAFSSAAPPEPDFPTDDDAVAALNAPNFLLREKAARHLWKRGKDAVPILTALAGGEDEPALRARSILEDIRLGITPDTDSRLTSLIHGVHLSSDDPEDSEEATRVSAKVSETLGEPNGSKTVLDLIRHETHARPPGWESVVTVAGRTLAAAVGETSPTYRALLAAVQGDALPVVVRGAWPSTRSFAYDAVTFSADPKKLPDPDRRQRVIEALNANSFPHPSSPEAEIARAEKKAGDPAAVPALLEKLLVGDTVPNADALTASLFELDLLDRWIEKYQKDTRPESPRIQKMALAQFLRAAGRHRDAFEIAKDHARQPFDAISFAFLVKDWTTAEKLVQETLPKYDSPLLGEEISKTMRAFFARLRNPDSPPAPPFFALLDSTLPSFTDSTAIETLEPLHLLYESGNYSAFAELASKDPEPLRRIAHAKRIAPISPPLSRHIMRGLTPEMMEKEKGAMGEFLTIKRSVGEEEPVIRYISERFATMTSDFWDQFLEKYFDHRNPLWIALHIRSREPKLSRFELMRKTLTEGTSALVLADVEAIFQKIKEVARSPHQPAIAYHSSELTQLGRLLGEERFASLLPKVKAWEDSFRKDSRFYRCVSHEMSRRVSLTTVLMDYLFGNPPTRKQALTSLFPNPAVLYLVGREELENGNPSEAVRWLAHSGWTCLSEQYWRFHEYEYSYKMWCFNDRIHDKPTIIATFRSLESALGLVALKKGDLETARKRFENLCAMGSLDHQLGTALFQKLSTSGQNAEAETLFSTRWNQLEAILEIAPRETNVCRALASWAKACNRRTDEGEIFAELADSLEAEHTALKARLSRFAW